MSDKPTIPIPRASEKEVVYIPSGRNGINSSLKNRLEKIDQVLYGVMISVVLSMVAIIVSVIGLFLDQMRVNNVVYKEYSEKTENIDNSQKSNQELLIENKHNQAMIIELQKLILKK